MTRIRLTLAFVLALGAFATPAHAIPGTIAFSSDSEILRTDQAGGFVSISPGAGFEQDPALSPDGEHVVFRRDQAGVDLWIADARDGSGQRNLTNDSAGDFFPSWSPDGERIAYASWRGGFPQLVVKDVSTGAETILTDGTDFAHRSSWSPDGTTLVFAQGILGGMSLLSVPADGSADPTPLTTGAADPAWSPDGDNIVFSALGGVMGSETELRIMPASGGSAQPVAGTEGGRNPGWSPDGGTLVFERGSDIFTIAVNGGVASPLAAGPPFQVGPTWGPELRPLPSAAAPQQGSAAPAPAPSPTPASKRLSGPSMSVGGGALRVGSAGTVVLVLRCPASVPGGCTGVVSLDSARKLGPSARKRTVRFGRRAFRIVRGREVSLRIRMSRSGLARLRRSRRVSVVLTLSARDGAGNSRTAKLRRLLVTAR
jgi:hypothetical protein